METGWSARPIACHKLQGLTLLSGDVGSNEQQKGLLDSGQTQDTFAEKAVILYDRHA